MKKSGLLLVILAIFAWNGCGVASETEATKFKFGTLPRILDLPLHVAQQEGIFKKHNLEVELVPFRSALERNAALQVGEIDGTVEDPLTIAILNKDKELAKVIASGAMPRLFEVVVSPGSQITTPAGLKNAEIGLSSKTIMDYALDRLLSQEGIDPKKTKKVDIPSMPLRVEMVSKGKIEAAILTPPLSTAAVVAGARVVLDDTKQPFAGPDIVFTLAAVEKKSDGIKRFLQAWEEATKAINSNPEKYQSLMAEVARVPAEAAKTEKVPTFPKMGLPDKAIVESKIGWLMEQGILSQRLPYERVVDTSFYSKD